MRVAAARSFSWLFPLALLAAFPPPVAAQEAVLVDVRDLSPREHRVQRFEIPRQQAVWIRAVGAQPRGRSFLSRFLDHGIFMGREPKWDGDFWPANAWIIDARTRRLVWELRAAPGEKSRKGVRAFEGTVMLPAGAYEAHYAALYPVAGFKGDDDDWRVPRRRATATSGPYLDNGAYREFGLVIRGSGQRLPPNATVARPDDVVIVTGADAEARERVGLALEQPASLELYGVGERAGSEWRDYGWIADAETGQRLWSFDDAPSEHAGGAAMNHMVSARLTLPAGRYLVSYVTDGSHHPGDWAETPPYDTGTWGLTVRVAGNAEQAVARPFAYERIPHDAGAVRLAGLGDDTLAVQAFAARGPLTLRVVALGEGQGGSLYDYGWIVDAQGRAVWRMDYGATQSAGGSDKNRVFEGEVRLEPGTYTAYFRTDGSHSFGGGFNSGRPFEGDLWGMTLWSDGAALQLDARRDEEALARLVRIGDDGDEAARFRLAAETAVRVLAIGEGDGEMYDYGWIENAAGTVVWRMQYDRTEHAGGASKNRRADEVIQLPAGEYVLRYRSDGSHAFGDWNADPPDDPLRWGVTVVRAERR